MEDKGREGTSEGRRRNFCIGGDEGKGEIGDEKGSHAESRLVKWRELTREGSD